MEARKITIVATREQKKYVVNSTAETLSELKRDLAASGINYNDMTFMEGFTKTEMKDDSSVLPTNVKRTNRETGEVTTTNELVFMLTNTAKKIKSGASRSELYAIIKSKNLQEKCKELYHKNYTQCKTSELEEVISAATPKDKEVKKECKKETTCKEASVEQAIRDLVYILEENGYIENYEAYKILANLNGEVAPDVEVYDLSDEEADELFSWLD